MQDPGTVSARSAASSITRWRNGVMTAFALGGVTVATWGPRLPQVRTDLRMGDAWIGVVLAGVTVGSITGLAAAAALLSWLGSRRGIGAMLGLVAAGIAAVGVSAGVAHSAGSTALGFVVVGFGVGAVDVMINVEGAAVERAAGRTLMPLLHAAWSAGAVAGAGIGAGCAALGVPVAEQFVAEAVLIAVTAAVAVRFLPAAADQSSTDAPSRRWGERIGGWLRAWGSLRLLLIGLVMLGVELGEGTANSWLTLAARDGHGQSDAIAALFFVAFAVGETLARVFGGPVVDRIGRVRSVRVTTALGVVGLVLFILASSGWLVLLGTLLWAVGVSMGFPLGMSAAAESGPNPAARVSVVASIGYLANLAGPPLIGFLSETVGVLTALWTLVALLAVGFAASDALRSPRSTPAS